MVINNNHYFLKNHFSNSNMLMSGTGDRIQMILEVNSIQAKHYCLPFVKSENTLQLLIEVFKKTI